MKITETISAKSMQKRSLAAIIIAVWTVVCLFTGLVSFSMLLPSHISHAEEVSDTESSEYKSDLSDADDAVNSYNSSYSYDYSTAAGYANDILNRNIASAGENDLQSLADNYFCENALSGNVQSYVQAIINNPGLSCDFTLYTQALSQALDDSVMSENSLFPTSLQKAVITLIICRSQINNETFSLDELVAPEVVNEVFFNTIGTKGIMTYIYGLNLLETCNDYSVEYSCDFTREDIILTLIDMQSADGGFSLNGDAGDVDVTAMALRALSGIYRDSSDYELSDAEKSDILSCIDNAISFLIDAQLATGDYSSYGNACSESTAQVILAASDLSLDYSTFINNDNSLLDGLLNYRLPDGSFSHTTSPLIANDMASAQAFEALCAICRTYNITASSNMTSTDSEATINSESTTQGASSSDVYSSDISSTNSATSASFSTKTILYIVTASLLVLAIIIFTIVYIRKKNRKRYLMQIISSVIIAAVASIAIFSINISTREEYLSAPSSVISAKPGEGIISITYSINCGTVRTGDPADIYTAQTLYVTEGVTAFDVLTEICRLNDIQLDYESNSVYGTAYIKAIDSLYEFDHGDLSGWMYRVNGEFPSVGCGYYVLKEGDSVEWLYTTNIGEDLKND